MKYISLLSICLWSVMLFPFSSLSNTTFYASSIYSLEDALEVFEQDGLYGVRKTNGEIVVAAIYENIECCNECFWGEIGFQVKLNGKFGFLNQRAEMVVEPLYDDVGFCWIEGMMPVKIEDKWGFINEAGEVIGEIKYNQVKDFYNGLASVNIGGKVEEITIEDEDEYGDIIYVTEFDTVGSKWGVINTKGEIKVPFLYEMPIKFEMGQTVAIAYQNWKYGLIDKNGNEVTEFIYDDLGPFVDGKAKARLNGEVFYINAKGERINE